MLKITEECRNSIIKAIDMMDKADKIGCSYCGKEMLSKVTNLGNIKVLTSYCDCRKGEKLK